MAIFNENDSKTLKILGYTAVGFAVLTVALIVISVYLA
tara:strand:+ start:578 stop:691 length:114 start_codon:yes stop_codon:yes gene_type:complete